MAVVDSHQHFWDPADLALPALPAEASILTRAYLPDDLRPDIEAVGVARTVFVQIHPQSPATNEWMFSQANAADYAAELGVLLVMEVINHYETCVYYNVDPALGFMADVDHDNVARCAD